jgi:hypothetical protein
MIRAVRIRVAFIVSFAAASAVVASACEHPAPTPAAPVTAPPLDERAAPSSPSQSAPARVFTADTDPDRLVSGTTSLEVIVTGQATATSAPSTGVHVIRDAGLAMFVPPVAVRHPVNAFAPKVVAEGPLVLTDAVTDAQGVLLFIAPSAGGCGNGGDWNERPEGAQLVSNGQSLIHPGIHGARYFIKAGFVLCVTGVTWANDAGVAQLSWTGFTPY